MTALRLDFGITEEKTLDRITLLFNDHQPFFELRGIATAADLAKVISWKFPLAQLPFENSNFRCMLFSNGFNVNWVDKLMTGYSVTVCASDTIKNVFDASCPFGFGMLFGTTIMDASADKNVAEYLKILTQKLAEIGFWSMQIEDKKEGIELGTCLVSGDRVVAYMKDSVMEYVRYIYIKTQAVMYTPAMKLKEYSMMQVKRNIEETVPGLVIECFTGIMRETQQGFDKSNVIKVWHAYFNEVVRGARDYVAYNNCYAAENQRGVIRHPADGMISIFTDKSPIGEDKFMLARSHEEQMPYLLKLCRASFSLMPYGMGYFSPCCVNMTCAPGQAKKLDSRVAAFRKDNFTFLESGEAADKDAEETIKRYEETLAYDAVVPNGVVGFYKTELVARSVVCQTPPRLTDKMTDSEFADFCERAQSASCHVHVNNLPRIISFLTRIQQAGKTFDFKTTDDNKYLTFSIQLIKPVTIPSPIVTHLGLPFIKQPEAFENGSGLPSAMSGSKKKSRGRVTIKGADE